MNVTELSKEVANRLGISNTKSFNVICCAVDVLSEKAVEGENIKLGKFGFFELRTAKKRIGTNPKTGDVELIPEHEYLHFNAGREVKEGIAAREQTRGDGE